MRVKKGTNLIVPRCPYCGQKYLNDCDFLEKPHFHKPQRLKKDGDNMDVQCNLCDKWYVIELNILTRYSVGKIKSK